MAVYPSFNWFMNALMRQSYSNIWRLSTLANDNPFKILNVIEKENINMPTINECIRHLNRDSNIHPPMFNIYIDKGKINILLIFTCYDKKQWYIYR